MTTVFSPAPAAVRAATADEQRYEARVSRLPAPMECFGHLFQASAPLVAFDGLPRKDDAGHHFPDLRCHRAQRLTEVASAIAPDQSSLDLGRRPPHDRSQSDRQGRHPEVFDGSNVEPQEGAPTLTEESERDSV